MSPRTATWFLLVGLGCSSTSTLPAPVPEPAVPVPPAPVVYNAEERDLPPWARQGHFHFIRVDGGEIESKKALRTHWGVHFSERETEILSNIYGKYSDTLFKRLGEADYNWIWVTWSNGWSTPEEEAQWAVLRRFIQDAHSRQIKVTAYLSASNMFWESMFRDEPRSITWVRIEDGLPLNYHGRKNKMRFLADIGNPEWRAYVLDKAGAAIDAGVDGVFFDNIKGPIEYLQLLFSEFQDMAAKKARSSGNRKAVLYVNAHLEPEKMALFDIGELIHNEYGKTTPGVWDDIGWDVGNVRKTKFLHGSKYPWQSHKYELDVYHCGTRESCIPSPVEQKLSIVEAWAFGSAFSKNLEGPFLAAIIAESDEGMQAWKAIAQYNRWISAHREFYTDVSPMADIAVLAQSDGRGPAESATFRLMDHLLKQSIMFETKVVRRFAQGRPFEQFAALLIAEPIGALHQSEKEALRRFVEGGGRVLATAGDRERLPWLDIRPITGQSLARLADNQPPLQLFEEVDKLTAGRHITMGRASHVLGNAMVKNDRRAAFVHLINYQHDRPEQDLTLTIDLKKIFQTNDVDEVAAVQAVVVSPDSDGQYRPKTSITDAIMTVTLDRLVHYSIVVLRR